MKDTKYWRSSENRKYVLNALNDCRDIILFDTETTGLKSTDHIIEIAAIKYHINNDNSMSELDRLHIYIKPPFKVSEEIENLTGITNAFLSDKPAEEDVFDEINRFFDAGIIYSAYNSGFDIRMLKAMYERNGKEFIDPIYEVDVLKMARDIVKPDATESYKLCDIAHILGFDEGVEFHSAIEDILVTSRLFEYFLKEYVELDNEAQQSVGSIKPKILSVAFWRGYKGFSRIYVNTDYGSLYFDIRRQNWCPKQNEIDVEQIDMEYLQAKVLEATNSTNLNEFAKFTGNVQLS